MSSTQELQAMQSNLIDLYRQYHKYQRTQEDAQIGASTVWARIRDLEAQLAGVEFGQKLAYEKVAEAAEQAVPKQDRPGAPVFADEPPAMPIAPQTDATEG